MFAEVSFPISSYQTFSYKVPERLTKKITIGIRVKVPLGSRNVNGIVVGINNSSLFKGKIREIHDLIDDQQVLNDNLWSLIKWLSKYYNSPLGLAAKAVLPSNLSTKYKPKVETLVKALNVESFNDSLGKAQKAIYKHLQSLDDSVSVKTLSNMCSNPKDICNKLAEKGLVSLLDRPIIPNLSEFAFKSDNRKITLTQAQKVALEKMVSCMDKNKFSPILLHGVTGSGKTEIYIEAARHAININKTVIILLPEISLTPQIAGRFRSAFGDDVALWHSKLSQGARAWTWKQICGGKFKVVIGARSAIFAPLKNVGLIVVDEEQESSYKQESPSPRYHARDVALMRGKLDSASVILASATPSMESYYNHLNGKYDYIHLKERFGGAKYPKVHVVDMIKEAEETELYGNIFSRLLLEKIQDRLSKKEQIILFHNRRGFAPVLRCEDCGEISMCPHCNISLTYHRIGKYLQCHFCNHTEKEIPSKCPSCQSFKISLSGTGTQKVEDELLNIYPNSRIKRLDADSVRSGINLTKILQEFHENKIDILLGTQMIAKGLDFANATLVGIINGDTGLFLPDFRSSEKVFQLIYQASGRSGRGEIPGEVIVQTYSPDNPVIKSATKLNVEEYYNICLEERKALLYPPYSWIVKLEIRGKKINEVEESINRIKNKMVRPPKGISILGPALCYREKLRDYYRIQLILKSKKELDVNGSKLHKYYKSILSKNIIKEIPSKQRLIVDINPVSLL